MENASLLVQSDSKDTTVVIDEKDISSSTRIEDNHSMVDVKRDANAVEMMEEIAFVVEESGVIHIKTKMVFKKEDSTMVDSTTNMKSIADDAACVFQGFLFVKRRYWSSRYLKIVVYCRFQERRCYFTN